jgi:hypothetical protein
MKSRRGFLAALGLGAGASVLGLPATAQAWGRRRRGRDCCNECGGVIGDCPCPKDQTKGRVPYAQTTPCDCCRPIALYATGNNVWYYYCECCPPPGNVFAASSVNYNGVYPPDCSNPSVCLGSGCVKVSPAFMRKTKRKIVFDNFFLDPDAKDPKGNPHADAYMNGLMAPKAANLTDDKGRPITPYANVSYGGRYVVLYEIIGPTDTLRIGIEVTDLPPSTLIKDPFASAPEIVKLPHYHQVQLAETGDIFHVAIKK